MIVKYKLLSELARRPSRMSAGAAGHDLYAAFERPITLLGADVLLVPTGLALEIPFGYEGQIRPRSGLAMKGVTVMNAPGTIDSDYRGEVKVLLVNHSDRGLTINPGDRIAQLVFAPVVPAVILTQATELDSTDRGEAGFGSTGT